jgi:hypothetical protein
MFKNSRNRFVSLGSALVVMLLATFLAACGSLPILIPVPVASDGEPVVIVLVTATPAAVPDESAAAEDDEEEAGSEEAAAGENEEIAALIIPHKFVGREDCTECHEAGEGKHASPADHAGYLDGICVYCHEPEEDDIAMTPLPEEASSEFCLGCHGPYEELMARTEELLVDEDGVTGNPHDFVPHDSDKIVECDNCHEVHALAAIPEEIPPVDADYCYLACHHEETFEPCINCHDEGSGSGE